MRVDRVNASGLGGLSRNVVMIDQDHPCERSFGVSGCIKILAARFGPKPQDLVQGQHNPHAGSSDLVGERTEHLRRLLDGSHLKSGKMGATSFPRIGFRKVIINSTL